MKKIILSLTILAFAFGAKAQDMKLSAGVNAGVSTSTGANFAFGADLQADFGLDESLAVTASAGYENFRWKGGGGSGFIPLLGGAKFTFGDSQVYGHAQLGYGIATWSGGGGFFAYAPSVGYKINDNVDASIKYLAFTKSGGTLGMIGVRVAYNF